MTVATYLDNLPEPTDTTGTGSLTLNDVAVAGSSVWPAAADGLTFIYGIKDPNGTAWEVSTGVYTDATKALTRTLISSSTGSLINISATGAEVAIIVDAKILNDVKSKVLVSSTSSADSNQTGVVGEILEWDISGFTANRNFTLPAICAVGDCVGIITTTGDDTYAATLLPATGDDINGGAAGAEWSRLFITGETSIFRCVVAIT